jgi:hypothetical protein
MRYSTQALAADLPLKPLIDIHQQMIDGLRTQDMPQVAGTYSPQAQDMVA